MDVGSRCVVVEGEILKLAQEPLADYIDTEPRRLFSTGRCLDRVCRLKITRPPWFQPPFEMKQWLSAERAGISNLLNIVPSDPGYSNRTSKLFVRRLVMIIRPSPGR